MHFLDYKIVIEKTIKLILFKIYVLLSYYCMFVNKKSIGIYSHLAIEVSTKPHFFQSFVFINTIKFDSINITIL